MVAAAVIALAAPLSQVKAQSRNYNDPTPVYQSQDVEDPGSLPRKELTAENISMKEISIYPNPASDIINISFGNHIEGRRRISIYDLLGNNVHNLEIDESGGSISVSQLKPGIYILVAGSHTFKIQKI